MPARAHLIAASVAGAIAASGCRAPQPQVPTAQAKTLSSALGAIGAECGESYQRGANADLERAAVRNVAALASVYRQGAQWIYQGSTVAQIVSLSSQYLRDCRLSVAARALQRLQ